MNTQPEAMRLADELCAAHERSCTSFEAAADPLPPSIWRYQLKRLAYWMLVAILGLFWMAFLVACAAYSS